MGWFKAFLAFVSGNIWLCFFLPCVVICGLLLSVRCKAVQLRLGFVFKMTLGRLRRQRASGNAVSPFQALTTALSSTVGTGNIIGTAQAIAMGGFGAVFWLWVAAILGMVIKYTEVCLSVLYRHRGASNEWLGGPMYYIEHGLGKDFRGLAKAYALFAALAAFGIGNMVQMNSAASALSDAVSCFVSLSPGGSFFLRLSAGLGLAIILALILAGGALDVGRATEKLVPFMSAVFLLVAFSVIICRFEMLLPSLQRIIREAFRPEAPAGATAGLAMQWGLRRSAFSNEAGLGTAAIAHASADTASPVEQGFWGIFEVFADTMVICSTVALTIMCSGVSIPYGSSPGVALMCSSIATVYGTRGAALLMSFSMLLFSFSSVLGWALYGSRSVHYLFGERSAYIYRCIFAAAAALGCVMSAEIIWDISDLFNALLAIPNFFALFLLSGKVAEETEKYFSRLSR